MMKQSVFSAVLMLICAEHASGDLCESLSPGQLSKELASLNATIRHHDRLYYHKYQPEITDSEYDALTVRREALQNCLNAQTESAIIESPSPGDIRHIAPMKSLRKGKSRQEFQRFIEDIHQLGSPVLVQPKVDGIAAELVYQNGKLVQASTRGDGEWGENILPVIRMIPQIPKELKTTLERIVLHGEIFARLDRVTHQLDNYVSARHFTAAMLNSDQHEPDNLAILDFFPWRWINHHGERDSKSHQQLADWDFFKVSDYSRILPDINAVDAWRNQLYQSQESMPFLMDGIVIKADVTSVRTQLGENARYPHWAIAWKFPASNAITAINDITFTIGRTGKITAILQLEPTTLAGISITKVPVGSVKQLKAVDIAPKDLVSIALKGAAIPKLDKVIHRTRDRFIPVPDTSRYTPWTCLRYSEACHQQFVSRLAWFSGQQGLNIAGLDATTREALIRNGAIQQLADVLKLTPDKMVLNSTLSQSNATRIHEAINDGLKIDFQRQLIALSIPGIGKHRAWQLAEHFGSWSQLVEVSAEDIASKTSLGIKQAEMVKNFLNLEEIQSIIRLLDRSVKKRSNTTN